jgi:hypothetical protein
MYTHILLDFNTFWYASAQIHPDFQPPLFEPSPITVCPQLACTPSTGPHASPPIKIHPVLLTQSTPLLIYVSHSSLKSPSFALLFQGGVLCSPLVVYVWCFTPSLRLVFTPPTANAYTTRSCYARLPARFGHIILSCGVQLEGIGEGNFSSHNAATLSAELQQYEGFSCRAASSIVQKG